MRRALDPGARVLVRLPAWLGDCVMVEPVIRALLARELALTLVGSSRFAEAFGWTVAPGVRFVDLARQARPRVADFRDHDVALLFDGSWRGALAAARAGIPERVGWATGGRELVLTQGVTPALERGRVPLGLGRAQTGARRLPRPFTSACVELAALVGLEVRDREPRITPPEHVVLRVAERLARHGVDARRPCVLVHAGARPESAKAVPIAIWSAILQRVRSRWNGTIVLACAPGEEAPARALAEALSGLVLLDAPALDLPETAALHRFAALVLAPDGGSVHLARASTRVPTVVLYGPTDPRHTAEHVGATTVERVEVPCGPCHDEHCPLPCLQRHQCLSRLDPARVADHTIELLERGA